MQNHEKNMNFRDLKIIISQIKRAVKCEACSKKFTDQDIEVMGTMDGENHYFFGVCSKCKAESIINATIQITDLPGKLPKQLPPLKKLGTAPRLEQISQNEVLDMRNFLKSFDGNFTHIFKR